MTRIYEDIELIIKNSLDVNMNIIGYSWRYIYDCKIGQTFQWQQVKVLS